MAPVTLIISEVAVLPLFYFYKDLSAFGCICIWVLHFFVYFTHQLLKDVLNTESTYIILDTAVRKQGQDG